ncbi:glycerophosphodiester phosphodiesterase family protein [Methylocystis parvus]|uniref:Glycerophosphodiester phosphodiesterase n=1 Tax=Methylocystis parvus TaxID=134 RepID=A0A6B8M052_9HYPH|nr:glycerophosphodiester phosphodiesterase family protein [Methylocystis parvus]QGM96191.1 glycerophosphodiester phosphodiesterase [Methylocystis parvus]WBJ99983.1 glycerophosphodiester phosphodiesterase [Methylocystis parvus OBBP]
MSARNLDWLTARPIAHRGLHDEKRGVVENSIGAARAAIAAGYAIECDVQPSRDGDLVVFHDDTLERLTNASGRAADLDTGSLSKISLLGSSETIPAFSSFLAAIDGRVPLVVELKSDFNDDLAPARRLAKALAQYSGPVVIESFDPAPIAFLRAQGDALGIAHIPLGIVGEASYDLADWPMLSEERRVEMTHFLHYARTRPDFLSWNVADLPHAIPFLMRDGLRLPVTTWTVRSAAQAEAARHWADQIVFEGFAPNCD